jgi:DNA-directed RNA polymerase specialized sigma24 family protein
MSDQSDLNSVSLNILKHRCSEESDRYFRRQNHDPRYCFELIRRAIVDQNQPAWNMVYTQYQPLVAGWIRRHTLFSSLDEELQFFINRTFEKMWHVLTPEKFAQFPDLKSILRYLQMCVHSVIVDTLRAREQAQLLEDLPGEPMLTIGNGLDGPEVQILDRSQAESLWEWIEARLKNDQERRVVYCSFVLDLKPAQIYDQHKDIFQNVREIYQIKENILARLRRDQELKEFL